MLVNIGAQNEMAEDNKDPANLKIYICLETFYCVECWDCLLSYDQLIKPGEGQGRRKQKHWAALQQWKMKNWQIYDHK